MPLIAMEANGARAPALRGDPVKGTLPPRNGYLCRLATSKWLAWAYLW
jgi:hypothetical protein